MIYKAILRTQQGETARLCDALAAGLLFGIAIWVKYITAIEASTACIALAGVSLLSRYERLGRVLVLASVYGVACWLPTAVTVLIYALRGKLGEFTYANFWLLLGYLGADEVRGTPYWKIRAIVLPLFSFAVPFGFMALAVGWRLQRPGDWPPSQRALLALTVVWLAAAAIGALAPGKYYGHCFLMLLPPLSVASGLALARIGERIALTNKRGALVLGTALLIIVSVLMEDWSSRAMQGFGIALNDTEPRVAAAVHRHLSPGETLWMVNFQPVVYFLTSGKPTSKYVLPHHLIGGQRRVVGADAEREIARILQSRPGVIVLDQQSGFGQDPHLLDLVAKSLTESYVFVDVIQGTTPVGIYRLR